MPTVTMTLEEYDALIRQLQVSTPETITRVMASKPNSKPKRRKTSAYNRRYKAAFKKVSGKYKLKNGNWKSNGFRSAVRAAHKMAGGKR